jgi:hypothetical protein
MIFTWVETGTSSEIRIISFDFSAGSTNWAKSFFDSDTGDYNISPSMPIYTNSFGEIHFGGITYDSATSLNYGFIFGLDPHTFTQTLALSFVETGAEVYTVNAMV